MKLVARFLLLAALLTIALAVAASVWFQWGGPAHPADGAESSHEDAVADSSPAEDASQTGDGFRFQDIAADLGVTFQYFRGDTGQLWTIEPHGGGVTCLDLDGDGLQDLFFVNGKQLPPDPSDATHISQVYRNRASGQFDDVTYESGLAINIYGQGCSSADYDNDGFPDLVVTGWEQCLLYRNNGDGTFRDVSDAARVSGGKWNTGACFADFDRDGTLDLFIANYLDFNPAVHKPCMSKELRVGYCGPHHYAALDDYLLHGGGDGTFQDVSQEAGIRLPRGPGFGGVAADVDNDGWPDLLVANDAEPNFLLMNQGGHSESGSIHFVDAAAESGVALNGNGLPEANMGVACGDFDGNGWLDFGISHFYQEHFTLYQNLGPRGFQDVTQRLGLDFTTRSKMGWGTSFIDADLDGWLDLFVVNGHINDNPDGAMPYRMTAQIFRNQYGGRFVDVSRQSGSYFQEPHIGRGTAVVDLDNDGKPEIVVVHHHAPVAILTNRTVTTNHVLTLRLVGSSSSRDATNARAVATLVGAADGGMDRLLLRECVAGEGYLGSNDKRLWFGLGDRQQVDRLEIHWPSGRNDTYSDLPASEEYLLIEGQPLRTVHRDRGE